MAVTMTEIETDACESAAANLEHNGPGHILDPHVRLSLLAGGVLVVLGLLSVWHEVWVQLLPDCLQLCISHAITHPAIHTGNDAYENVSSLRMFMHNIRTGLRYKLA